MALHFQEIWGTECGCSLLGPQKVLLSSDGTWQGLHALGDPPVHVPAGLGDAWKQVPTSLFPASQEAEQLQHRISDQRLLELSTPAQGPPSFQLVSQDDSYACFHGAWGRGADSWVMGWGGVGRGVLTKAPSRQVA